ncbi:HTH-type transcriptional activator AmpR [Serratia quinivorans]|uniref:LysR family transcriptional regulator n=1 Tax=Serratia quinivorans TaxID=137545 RepID=UPI0021795714|nr:LysR family transcriptional regulator [Serratia quinivorans]CAI1723292.1 HTH-type transcriptional activator AmpR [Serratia quinivorans]
MYLVSKNLRSFMVSATKGSFTEAAESLNITTSPLSKMISGLESYFGTKLFFRTPDGITLSHEGEALYQLLLPHYEALCNIENDLRGMGRIQEKNIARELVIGSCGGFLSNTTQLISEVLNSKIFNSVRISLIHGKSHLNRKEEAFKLLSKGNIQVLLSYEPFDFSEEVETLSIGEVKFVALISSKLHEKYPSDQEKLKNIPLIQHDFEADNPLHQMFKRKIVNLSEAKRPITLPELNQRVSAVEQGLGFSLIPEALFTPKNNLLQIVPFMEEDPIIVNRYVYFLKESDEEVKHEILSLLKSSF